MIFPYWIITTKNRLGGGLTIHPHKKHFVQETQQQPRIGRNQQQRPSQRTTDNDLTLATWNLRSLYRTGALQNALSDLENYKIHVTAVQETRWLNNGIHDMGTHTLYYSGTNNNIHEFGTGFFVAKHFDCNVIGFTPISKYMCTLRFRTNRQKVTLINIHAPTEVKDDTIKENFYNELENTYNRIPSSDIKIVLGDFNAQIGKEDCIRSIAGRHSLHELCNDNGSRVVNFATTHGMIVRSTQFERKQIHKVSWTSNDGTTKTQIDHVLIEKKYYGSITNIRSYRGTVHESDHALVKVSLRCKWLRNNIRRVNVRPKFNIEKLKTEETQIAYQAKIEQALREAEITSENNTDEAVTVITECVLKAAEDVLGRATTERKGGWFDEECKMAVLNKKNARLRLQQHGTRNKRREYQQLSKQVYRLLRRKKREHLNREIENLESQNRNGNVREFYKMVKKQRHGFQTNCKKILNENGDLLSDKEDIVRRWKEYFVNLLNKPEITQPPKKSFSES